MCAFVCGLKIVDPPLKTPGKLGGFDALRVVFYTFYFDFAATTWTSYRAGKLAFARVRLTGKIADAASFYRIVFQFVLGLVFFRKLWGCWREWGELAAADEIIYQLLFFLSLEMLDYLTDLWTNLGVGY